METKLFSIDDCPVLVPVLNHVDAGRIASERGYVNWMFVQRGKHSYMLVSLCDFEKGRENE